jgi:Kdo2-lipid IVA lauroyltransferase/acyltransferase
MFYAIMSSIFLYWELIMTEDNEKLKPAEKKPGGAARPRPESSNETDNSYMPFIHRARYFIIRNLILGLGLIAAVLPDRLTYRICVALTVWSERRFPKYRKLARRHLEIAFGGEKSPGEIDAILHETYVNYGKNLAEFLLLPHKSKEWFENHATFDDPNWIVRTEFQKGRGVVMLAAHFGSWELVNARVGIHNYPLTAVVRAQRDAFMSRFIMETRGKFGNEFIFRMRGVKEECFRQLDKGKLLALMADQHSSHGVWVTFFGKPAQTATGPAEIAMKRGLKVVVPAFPARNPDDTITLHVFDPIPMRDTGNYEEDLAFNVQQCNDSIERFARQHPSEYFWWHRRWRTPKNDKKSE